MSTVDVFSSDIFLLHFNDAEGRNVRSLFCLLVAFIVFSIWLLKAKKDKDNGMYFRHPDGRKMKELQMDTRYRRFSHGRDVSEEGYRLAQGEPFIVWNGRKREIVLNRPEYAKEFYQGDGKDHVKPHNMNMGHFFGRVLGRSVGVQSGHNWKTTRGYFDPLFSHPAAMYYQQLFTSQIRSWLEKLPKDPTVRARSDSTFVVDAVSACRVLPFKLVAIACYGHALTDKIFEELLELNTRREELTALAFFGKRTTSKLYGMLPTRSKRMLDQFEEDWEKYNMKIVDEARKTGVHCPAKEIFANVQPNGKMTMSEYLQTIDEILFTNIDVTSAVLAFLLINLGANTGVQEELRTEVKASVPDRNDQESLAAYIARSDTLLEFTCMESVRLCPAAWFTFPEYSPNDKVIGGFLVPAGTPIIFDWMRINTAAPVWNPPDKPSVTGRSFVPTRFRELPSSQYRYSFLRFGLGPRKCIGKNYAAVMMKAFLIEVLPEWRLELANDPQGLKEGGGTDAESALADIREDRFTVTPRQDVRFVRLE